MTPHRIRIKAVGRDRRAAYLALPGHTRAPGVVARTVRVDELVPGYRGPRVNLDFAAGGRLIGIEVVVFDSDVEAAAADAETPR